MIGPDGSEGPATFWLDGGDCTGFCRSRAPCSAAAEVVRVLTIMNWRSPFLDLIANLNKMEGLQSSRYGSSS